MKKYIKIFFYLLDSQAKKHIPFLILAFLFSSLLDVIGVGLIGVFLGLLTSAHLFLNKLPRFFLFIENISQLKLILISGILIISAFTLKAIMTLVIQAKVV